MAAKNPTAQPRPVRIPIGKGSWWQVAAMAAEVKRARELNIREPGIRSLAEKLAEVGVVTDEDTVGRNLRGEIVTWDVAVPLSKILGIAPPAIIPENDDEAELIASLLSKLRGVRR